MSLATEGRDLALRQAHDKCVMLLLPTRAGEYQRLPENIHIRFSDEHSGLKCLPVDVLIVVDPDNDDFDEDGYLYAMERTRAQRDPKILFIPEPA